MGGPSLSRIPTNLQTANRPSTSRQGFQTDPAGDDWLVLLDTRANMLVIGSEAATAAFVHAATPHVRSPVQSLSGGVLPPRLPGDGTLILRDVDALDGDQQERLLRWLCEPLHSHTQVISLTTTTLYLRVQAGMFSDRLYYRLNVIHFEVIPD